MSAYSIAEAIVRRSGARPQKIDLREFNGENSAGARFFVKSHLSSALDICSETKGFCLKLQLDRASRPTEERKRAQPSEFFA